MSMNSRSFTGRAGGSSSEHSHDDESKVGYFQPGVRYDIPTAKKLIQGRILPAFDYSLASTDTTFKSSVVPYRDLTMPQDKLTKTPGFTPWYVMAKGYKFIGRNQQAFLSPATLRCIGADVTEEETADPMYDLREWLWKQIRESSTPEVFHRYVDKPKDKNSKVPVPRSSDVAFLNTYITDVAKRGSGWNNSILVLTGVALEDLKKKLSWPTVYGEQPVDADFPKFLFGDVTKPASGLVFRMVKIQQQSEGGLSFNGMEFSSTPYSIEGAEKYPVDAKVLSGRSNLLSSDTLRILSYQDIVDIIADAGIVPYEYLAAACGHMADVRDVGGANRTVSSPAPSPAQAPVATRAAAPDSDSLDMSPPAHSVNAAPAPVAPVAAAEGKADVFWVSGSAAHGKAPVKMTRDAIMADSLFASLKVMGLNKGDKWGSPSDYGIVIDEAPAPPDETPAPPWDDTPAAPEDDAPPSPAAGGLTPEEKKRMDEYTVAFSKGTPPTGDAMTDFVQLAAKAGRGK